MTSMFYEHPQTLSLWSVHLENKGNLLLPNHVVKARILLLLLKLHVYIHTKQLWSCWEGKIT